MTWPSQLPALVLGALLGAGVTVLLRPTERAEPPSFAGTPRPSLVDLPVRSGSSPPDSTPAAEPGPLQDPGATLEETLAGLEDTLHPLLRSAELTQLGYHAAGSDPDHAITQIDAIQDHAAKIAFIKGIFTRVAEDKPPFEAIQRVKRLDRSLEMEGFKSLIAQWTGAELPGNPDLKSLSAQLLSSGAVSADIKDAWLKSYQNHAARSGMAAEAASALLTDSPEAAFDHGQEFTGWERQNFHETLARRWMLRDPGAAWSWMLENRQELREDALSTGLRLWSERDHEAALAAFESLTDSVDRVEGASVLAEHKALREGTEAAVAWADRLPTVAEQDAAHEAIYVATPRGIGAALSSQEGYLTIGNVLQDSPAQQAGLRNGDRIVEVDSGEGQFHPLSGETGLQEAVSLIRGEAGSNLRLRVLRDGGTSEVIELQREQLILGREPQPRPIPSREEE